LTFDRIYKTVVSGVRGWSSSIGKAIHNSNLRDDVGFGQVKDDLGSYCTSEKSG